MTTTAPPRSRRLALLRRPGRDEARARRRQDDHDSGEAPRLEPPPVDIAPHDPALAYFQQNPEPVDLETLKLESPAVAALREAGVKLVVPLVTQGELIGLLNLGERLSEQEYSADDRKLLENLAGQAAPALRVAQLVREQEAEVRRRERYEQELRVATLIQQNFLPRELPEPAGYHLNAFYRPAREVGGDFYDVIELSGGRLGIVVADVTDKGVPAALVMASTRSVLRASAQRLVEPGAVLERVNDQVCPDMPPKMFVTCLYGVLDPWSGRFVFANAGHNLPCLRQAEGGAEEHRATGMPLGLLPGMTYEEAELTVPPGGSLLLYSDGIPEAHAPDGEMFGFPELVATVGAPGTGEIIDRVLSALHRFTGSDWEQEDDLTLVSLRRSDQAEYGDEPMPPGDPELVASFDVPSEPGTERRVIDLVLESLRQAPLSEDQRNRLSTAVGEAAMNAIEHGNANHPDVPVDVEVLMGPGGVTVRITDQGGGASVEVGADEPDLEAKLRGDQSPRGWGLFLIRNMVDALDVHTDGARHTVELHLRLEGDSRE